MTGYTHTLQDNILGEIVFATPWRLTYVYGPTDLATFDDVGKLQVMKTGCYVLHFAHHRGVVVVAPGFRYCVESPMEMPAT